ncbi:MAG: aminopeptidase P N-terminal domain-containing protein [Bifidobacteriaceae bacterium]|jgi:Xaa-Pro aminopeptidase|nr:aminopeptidase P N-terminal domain-containing protein [Bifidobacteriaceae bacterium]
MSLRSPQRGALPRLTEVDAFSRTMAHGWEPMNTPLAMVPGAAQAAARHRQILSDALGANDAVVFAGEAPIRNDDCFYAFRPNSTFAWLTGCALEFAVIVLKARPGGHDATLFATPPARPDERDFFASPAHGELWVGPSPGLAEVGQATGLAVRPLSDLDQAIGGLGSALFGGGLPPDLAARRSQLLEEASSTARMIKDEWEIGQLREAIAATVRGFEAVAAALPDAIAIPRGERWLQATFDRTARTLGNGPGYASIVGSGAHAPILHWVRCDGQIDPHAPLLLDMGVEAQSLYTADVTRTIPPSGTFSPAARQVHDLVEAAHRAGLAAATVGADYLGFHFAAMEVIAQGLKDWGVLEVSVDEALSPGGQQHRRYIVCGIGHHLGLDVHDCSRAERRRYEEAALAPGMVFTVEPGLYFHANDLTVPPELRGIGVRIEDDLLILPDGGAEVLSADLPIDASGLEDWTGSLLRAPR